MLLNSVRALKAEIAEAVVQPAVTAAAESGRLSVSAMSLRRAVGPSPAVALGVAQGRRGKDFRLAVRLQRRLFEADAEMLAEIERRAKGEVDIRYVGRINKLDEAVGSPWNRSRQRPLLVGASIGHYAITAGTLGGFVTHRKMRKTVILSNNHVLADEDAGKVGDAVLQPGVYACP